MDENRCGTQSGGDAELLGGKLIGEGSFGCVFHPALNCSGKNKQGENKQDEKVSKIFFGKNSNKEAREEIKINQMVKQIKGYQSWSHIWDKNCKPNKYEKVVKEDGTIDDCLYNNDIDEDEFNKNSRMLQGSYGGDTLSAVFTKLFTKSCFKTPNTFSTTFLKMVKQMKPLFVGLESMNRNKLSHNDIKSDNIMVDSEGCKYIDFGLAAKHSDTSFFKRRTMSEFIGDRIYPCYPYEFLYLYATPDVLEDEKSDIEYDIFRDLHDRYKLVHETLFKRGDSKQYLLQLIQNKLDKKLSKEKQKMIINLVDTYSLGYLLPYMLCKISKKHGKITQCKKYSQSKSVKPFMDLFKSMCEPDCENRIKPGDALQRYLELETLYLSNTKKQSKKTPKRTFRKA